MLSSDWTVDEPRTWSSTETEQAVLGAMLLDPHAAALVFSRCQRDFFWKHAHGDLFDAAQAVQAERKPVDIITVANELKRQDLLDDCGGSHYLVCLLGECPWVAHLPAYIDDLAEYTERRYLIWLSGHIQGPNVPSVDDIESRLQEIRALRRCNREAKLFGEYPVEDSVAQFVRAKQDTKGRPCTGLRGLDTTLGGLPCPGYVVVMGDSGMGKTALALMTAHATAVVDGLPVLFFSLEMDVLGQLAPRMAFTHLQTSAANEEALVQAVVQMAPAPLYVHDAGGVSIEEVEAETKRIGATNDLALVVVDYLQLVTGHHDRQYDRLMDVSRRLQAMAKQQRCTVLALSQVTWDSDKKDSSAYGSRGIEQDADLVLEVLREGPTLAEKRASRNGRIVVRKNRMGPVTSQEVLFEGCWMTEVQREGEQPTTFRGEKL